ncbi:PD-(D/E)XK motif protein [Ferrovibrio xuzhouensis]|uniref:PD-(D/E)XK motif protein n=1 Tax=Ferrovibrio xuzhouensis TaxID=1576914 RepID=A0ABV7VJU3_9PROT
MTETPNPALWSTLRANRPRSEGSLVTAPIVIDGSPTPLSVAMDSSGFLHLMIPVQSGPVGPKPADLNGLRLRHSILESGEVLDLSAPPSHERVFTPFCRDIIDAVVVHSREPWAAAAATVRAWQSAWKPMRQHMEKTAQVGLFGELLFLNSIMLPSIGTTSIDEWSGPNQERHDFSGEQIHVEVKTTRKGRSEHEISRLDQLRVPDGRRLLLASIQVEESITGEHSLATQIDSVVEFIRMDAAALDLFMSKLYDLGWAEEMRESGEMLKFNVRAADVYEVDSDFPRIPDDFEQPSGVVSIKYIIDLANIPKLDRDETILAIREAHLG